MLFLCGFIAGGVTGLAVGCLFLDKIVRFTVAEVKKLDASAEAGLNKAEALTHKFVDDVKKDL
jgi:hypothetical protein